MSEVAKLKWRCRRGMRELDLLLENYCDSYYRTAESQEQQAFVELLEMRDDVIYDYLFSNKSPETVAMTALINKISSFNLSKS